MNIQFTLFLCVAIILLGPQASRPPGWEGDNSAAREVFRLNRMAAGIHGATHLRQQRQRKKLRKPDVIYYPTPNETVVEMLSLANIKPGDVLYDLGSGDGRIPIMAAQLHGIRAVGIEIDPKLISEAEEAARQAGVSRLVQFRNEDMFRANISEASVVTLYLSEKLNVLMRPKLWRELRPGTRVISHDFLMGEWKPERSVRVPWQTNLYRTIHLWTIPHR